MTPFYYIDGPLKGCIILGNFKQSTFIQGDTWVYRKHTYSLIVKKGDDEYRIICDIASITQPSLPKEAYCNILIDSLQDGPHPNLREFYPKLELYNVGSEVKTCKF